MYGCLYVCLFVCAPLRLLVKLYNQIFVLDITSYSTAAPEVGAGSVSWGPGKDRKEGNVGNVNAYRKALCEA